jgi:nitroimidazol reductase NimA-like FMN-containing flavoprotein (pyridoxamine 5'-phosphate oxidase superfamily)
MRRADLAMTEERARAFLRQGYSGRLATVGPDQWPYVVPLLYVYRDDSIYVHNSRAPGHLRANVDHSGRACFLVDEPGTVYGYGRFECDSSLSYSSVMAFGNVTVVEGEHDKALFCDELMRKYGAGMEGRPKQFYPRLDAISVYALRIERLTGKAIQLPAASARWPAMDRTKSPTAELRP